MEDASTAIADYNTRLGLTGEDLQGISKQALQVADMLGIDNHRAEFSHLENALVSADTFLHKNCFSRGIKTYSRNKSNNQRRKKQQAEKAAKDIKKTFQKKVQFSHTTPTRK